MSKDRAIWELRVMLLSVMPILNMDIEEFPTNCAREIVRRQEIDSLLTRTEPFPPLTTEQIKQWEQEKFNERVVE